MADNYWLGVAPSVAQVDTGSIDSVDGTPANNTFTVTVGDSSESQVGDTDVATTAAALVATLEASTKPEIAQMTWTNPSAGNIVATADVAGMPFEAALTETGAGTGTVTDFAATTANSSPYSLDVAANWSLGAVPVATDSVYVDKPAAKIFWGLGITVVAYTELHIRQDAIIGLKSETLATDVDASSGENTGAREYRQSYWTVDSPIVKIGERNGPGTGLGSTRCKIHQQRTTASVNEVYDTGQTSIETSLPAVRFLFDDADADLYIRAARAGVGVAIEIPGETSTLGTISVSDPSSVTRTYVGNGVTLTSWDQTGGVNQLNSAATIPTITINGGELTVEGQQKITTCNLNSGKLTANNVDSSSDCITTITQEGGEVDMQASTVPRTVATWNFHEGTRRIDDHATITADNRSGRVTEQVSPS